MLFFNSLCMLPQNQSLRTSGRLAVNRGASACSYFLAQFPGFFLFQMAQSYLPLRWESTGDQWWYASPIDWAAANGHYDIVRELLHLDTNLLIKLTSLRRIRRLETVWDDDARFVDAAKRRAFVARNLLHECEMKNRKNSLIRAGYGGWLLYTAASAGDMSFVQELLQGDPLLAFGEGEYGVTDILYAAAKSKNSAVFRLLFDSVASPRCSVGSMRGGDSAEGSGGGASFFRWEMLNRAVHAAARGGNLQVLKELLEDCSDVLAYRDLQGSTILHAASGRGQVEVAKDLVACFDIVNSRDNQGNTALHVAAFRGHLPVLEALIAASPVSSTMTNKAGHTFLHMAVAGFRTPGFRRLDKQMELMTRLINGHILNDQDIINVRNHHGRTALHMAVAECVHSDLVKLLMTVPSINLNIQDVEGMTPLDILRRHPRSASEILTKQLISAGGISNSKDLMARSAIASQLRVQGMGNSPGTSFRIPDAEIFLYTGVGASETSGRPSSCSSTSRSELAQSSIVNENKGSFVKKESPVTRAANRLKILLSWPHKKEKQNAASKKIRDDESFDSLKGSLDHEEIPTPLRQRFSRGSSLLNNKRTMSFMSSPATKKKFVAGLMHGVVQATPQLEPSAQSSSTSFSRTSVSSSTLYRQKGISIENENGASYSSSSVNGSMVDNETQKSGLMNTKLMNQYLCFGAQGLAVDKIR